MRGGRRAVRLLRLLLVAICCVTASAGCLDGGAQQVAADAPAPVILVSFDGWRWDYADRAATPHLDRLTARGARAGRLIPVFPTKTFPNHYSLVTGVHPEQHGIVSNTMYDPETGERFSLGNRRAVEDGRWWGGEPIWVTAERQGLRTAAMFWPGSEAEIGGVRPTFWRQYDSGMPGAARVRQVLDWLDLPAGGRPAFLTLYFSDVDSAGHRFGPDSPEVVDAIERVDAWLGLLLDGLETRGLSGAVNVLVTSDHGMAARDPDAIIFLDDYLDVATVMVTDWSPVVGLWPAEGRTDAVYDALRGRHPNLQVYRREEMPARFHYRAHPRIPPIVGLADEGWTVTTRDRLDALRSDWNRGEHGYDNALESMHGLFVAAGPAFVRGAAIERLDVTALHPLMADLLGLEVSAAPDAAGAWRPLRRAP